MHTAKFAFWHTSVFVHSALMGSHACRWEGGRDKPSLPPVLAAHLKELGQV